MAAFIAGCFILLAVLKHLFVPLMIAIVLAMLSDGSARLLARTFPRWPTWLRASLAAAVVVAGFSAIVLLLVDQAPPFLTEMKPLIPRLDSYLQAATARFGFGPITVEHLAGADRPEQVIGRAAMLLQGAAGTSSLVLLYLAFLLGTRDSVGRKISILTQARGQEPGRVARVVDRIARSVEAFIGLQTFKGVVIGSAAAGSGFLAGLSDSLFIGVLAFLLSFIPVVGTFIGAGLPALVAIAIFNDPAPALTLGATLGALVVVFDNLIMPRLQSDRMNLDPTLSIFSIGFWGVIFGLPGVLLSTPLTAACVALTAEFPTTRWVAVMRSRRGDVDQPTT